MLAWRLKIGRAFGIDVFLHWTFFLAPLYLVYLQWRSGLHWPILGISLVLLLTIFACVLFHEFGHALAARYFGVRTHDIIITPIGGLARLVNMPRDPLQEFAIAIAGPAVNLVIALAFGFYLAGTGQPVLLSEKTLGILQFPQLMFWLNLLLFLFNLIPAFPMDGGRILRSLLSVSFSHQTATLAAAALGQLVAVGFIVIGIFTKSYPLAVIGAFIFIAAAAEISFRDRRY